MEQCQEMTVRAFDAGMTVMLVIMFAVCIVAAAIATFGD